MSNQIQEQVINVDIEDVKMMLSEKDLMILMLRKELKIRDTLIQTLQKGSENGSDK